MCQMSVVVENNNGMNTIIENVTRLQVIGNSVEIGALFEEPQTVATAFIDSIDFQSGKVILKKFPEFQPSS